MPPLALTCSQCGHEVDPRTVELGKPVHCPRCGNRVAVDPELGSAGTRAIMAAETGNPDTSLTSETRKGGAGSVPEASLRVAAFDFLLPPKNADELGWLGHYRVVKLLGQGGMGMVFQATDIHLQRSVALKVMKPEVSRDLEFRQRFLREARATAAVKSDHIVTIHYVGEQNDVPYIAMEFLEGKPLDRWLETTAQPSVSEILRIGAEVARGLAAAHERGHIHRDIKPANIWIEEPGQRVKILDFGLARPTHSGTQLTQAGLIMGTPEYMAPEQAEGAAVDERCDLFSLGCVLYELATNEQAFQGANTMAVLKAVALKEPKPMQNVNPDLPLEFVNLVTALLAKKPEDRPRTAREVADVLDALRQEVAGKQLLSRSAAKLKQWKQTSGASRRRLLIAGALAVAALGLAGYALRDRLFSPGGRDTGAAASKPPWVGPGISAGEIVLGMSAPIEGPNRELGREMALGISVCFDTLNERGGVAGRKLRLEARDDDYDPDRALANIKELEQKVFAFIGNVGTPTAAKTVPYALDKRLLLFGAFTGAKLLRDPVKQYVLNYRASYAEETEAVVAHLLDIKRIPANQLAVFAQNDGYGEDGFQGVARALRTRKWNEAIRRVGYDRPNPDNASVVSKQINAAADEIANDKEISAVVMVATYRPAARFIQRVKEGRARIKDAPDITFTNVSFVGSEALADALRDLDPKHADGVIVTQVVPPFASGAPINIEFRDVLKKYTAQQPTFTALEGYIAAKLFVAGLERVGDTISTEKLIDTFESMQGLNLGLGTPLGFTPYDHQAVHKVWATKLDKDGTFHLLDLERP